MARGARPLLRLTPLALILLGTGAASHFPDWAEQAAQATGLTAEDVMQRLVAPGLPDSDDKCASGHSSSNHGIALLQRRANKLDVALPSEDDVDIASKAGVAIPSEEVEAHLENFALPALSRQPLEVFTEDSPEGKYRRRVSWLACGILGLLIIWLGLRWAISHHHELVGDRPDDSDQSRLVTVIVGVLFAWMLVGTAMFTKVVMFNGPFPAGEPQEQHLTIIEAIYVSSQIITTVGYGDFTPSRPLGQVFVACYIMFSAFIVGALVSEMFRILISGAEKRFLEPNHTEPDAPAHLAQPGSLSTSRLSKALTSYRVRDQKSLETMEMRAYKKLLFAIIPWFVCQALGTLFFHFRPGEDKTLGQAFYMSCVTLSSVGFGAFHPTTDAGRIFAAVWMVLGVTATGNLVLSFSDFFIRRHKVLRAEVLTKQLLEDFANSRTARDTNKVSRCDFLWYELVRLGITERAVVDEILEHFDGLDEDGNGELNWDELKAAWKH